MTSRDAQIQYTSGPWLDLGTAGLRGGLVGSRNLPNPHYTASKNATAIFTFEGVKVVVSGTLDPLDPRDMSSSLLYTLDGFQDTVFILNSTARALRILYSSPSLPSGPHTLVMTLTAANTSLSVQGMSIIVDSDAAATTVAHRIAEAQRWKIATIVGGTIGGLFMIIFLVCTITYHRRRERTRAAARLALGPMTVSLPMSKEAFTTRNYSNYGLSFSSAPPSTDSLPLPPKVQTPIHRTHNPPTNAALTTGSMTVPTIFCAESSH